MVCNPRNWFLSFTLLRTTFSIAVICFDEKSIAFLLTSPLSAKSSLSASSGAMWFSLNLLILLPLSQKPQFRLIIP
jgi:hypothetical protein